MPKLRRVSQVLLQITMSQGTTPRGDGAKPSVAESITKREERESSNRSYSYFDLIALLDRAPCGGRSGEWVCLITIGQPLCVYVCVWGGGGEGGRGKDVVSAVCEVMMTMSASNS